MTKIGWSLAATLVLPVATGCDGSANMGCTAIGQVGFARLSMSPALVRVGKRVEARVCDDAGTCATLVGPRFRHDTRPPYGVVIPGAHLPSGGLTLEATLVDDRGRVRATGSEPLQRHTGYPNGRSCGGITVYDGASLTLNAS